MSEELNNNPLQESKPETENNETQPQTIESQTPPPASPAYTSMYDKPNYNNNNDAVMPKNNMALGIIGVVISVLSCCTVYVWLPGLILGIISIVFSTQVKSKFNLNDIDGAEKSAKNAKICGLISIALGILALIYLIVIMVTYGGPAFMDEFNRQMELQGY